MGMRPNVSVTNCSALADPVLRSLVQYARAFAITLGRPDTRRLLLAHARGVDVRQNSTSQERTDALLAIAAYFSKAQDHGPDRGLGSYHLVSGWSASYPETSGYIIPTMLAMAEHLGRADLRDRAFAIAEWLLTIQRPDGGWQGGRVGEGRPSIVFNTAQVVRGMMAAFDAGGDQRYLSAAARACDWIVSVQEPDGTWAKHNFLGERRVYDTYVCAPLLQMHQRAGNGSYARAAYRALEWVLTRQAPNGWFANADNTVKHDHRPITHTIAYTLDGLIECHLLTGDERYLAAARTAADVLCDRFLKDGSLHGRYDADWKGAEAPLTTGCAQLAIVWSRSHAISGEARYKESAERMVAWSLAVQRMSFRGPVDGQGAVTGSFPLWGRYEKFACPNWAQKYLADALLCIEGRLPRY